MPQPVLPAYQAAIAVSVARSSDFADNTSGQHPINIAYLHFFLAFWWEHVLLCPQLLDASDAADLAETILKLSAAPAPATIPALAPAPAPPAPLYYPPFLPGPHGPPPFPGFLPGYPPVAPPWQHGPP